jgi:predicted PurR-regulated permease PerM
MGDYRWSPGIKRTIFAAGLVLAGILFYVIWPIVPVIGTAAVLSYLLLPAVEWMNARRVPRIAATALVFLLVIFLLVIGPALGIPALVRSAASINYRQIAETLAQNAHALLESYRTVNLAGNAVDLSPVIDDLQQRLLAIEAGNLPDLSSVLSAASRVASSAAVTVAGLLGTLVLVLIVAFYLVLDAPRMSAGFWSYVPPVARPEAELLIVRLNRVWAAFFRGQLLLGAVVGGATAVGGLVIGLPGALWLGLIAGILEVVPNFGPVLSAVPAVIVALVQGSSWLPASNPVFMLITLGMYILIQQLENNLLVPRIIGGAVGLPPVVVLLGAIVGASIAGLLGIFLAAPVIASLALLGRYAYNKLLDHPPFDHMPDVVEPRLFRGRATPPPAPAAPAVEAPDPAVVASEPDDEPS